MAAVPAELLRRLTNGVYVVTSRHQRRAGGFTAAWITQVSFDPLLLALSINPANATWPLIEQSRRLAINVLESGHLETARHFGLTSGRDQDKFAAVRTARATGDFVVLADAVAWVGCEVEHELPAGDHIVVIARVTAGDVLRPEAEPLRYSETGTMDGAAALFPTSLADDASR